MSSEEGQPQWACQIWLDKPTEPQPAQYSIGNQGKLGAGEVSGLPQRRAHQFVQ